MARPSPIPIHPLSTDTLSELALTLDTQLLPQAQLSVKLTMDTQILGHNRSRKTWVSRISPETRHATPIVYIWSATTLQRHE